MRRINALLVIHKHRSSPVINTHVRGKSIFSSPAIIVATPGYNTRVKGRSIFTETKKRGRKVNPNSKRQQAIRRRLNALALGLKRAPRKNKGVKRGPRWMPRNTGLFV